MATKIQVPSKHVSTPVSDEQDKEIQKIQSEEKLDSWLEAKRVYFERQAGNEVDLTKKAGLVAKVKKAVGMDAAEELAKAVEKDLPKPMRTNIMTIEQTKLGVTLVLSKDDCYALGFSKGTNTREAVAGVRKKLGLQDRKKIKKEA